MGATGIDDSAFRGCSRITSLNLASNQISTVSANAFADLTALQSLYLDSNVLTTLPENVFENQDELMNLDLSFNSFTNIPAGLFRPLENLQTLYIANANIDVINSQWFENNGRLYFLYLMGNRLSISADSFTGLDGVQTLIMGYNGISEIPVGALSHMPNLRHLYLNGNNFVELPEDTFTGLDELITLDISDNPLTTIQDGAFRGLENLDELGLSNCRLRNLRATAFENLTNVTFLSLNFNDIEELPEGLFEPTPNLRYIGLWYNRLKVLRRNAFGSLTDLESLGLDGNIVNALDRSIIDDAENLISLFFSGNLCASDYFANFQLSRDQYLPMLDRCFRNMRYIIDTTTEGEQYAFFDGPQPGIALRVNTDSEVQIALTPFPFVWNPVVEIFIGRANNTLSAIRFNQETDVAVVPTPNIIRQEQWNDFRVTWANQVVMVFGGNDTFPFMSYTMESFVPVNFYGLRAVDSIANWSVQPLDF
ncbi:hypothetical protein HA402_014867 [Bradysia odoriphaga]|nr:hypothetical protein HA402_014867 [Bradysia odoriphaga]